MNGTFKLIPPYALLHTYKSIFLTKESSLDSIAGKFTFSHIIQRTYVTKEPGMLPSASLSGEIPNLFFSHR